MAASRSETVSLMLFLRKVLQDLEDWCSTSTSRDYKTVAVRVEHEGLSFLTITLPTFGKEFERALDQGYVGPNQFAGFSRAEGLPRFLGGFLDRVFDRGTGRLLASPSTQSIYAVRQITLMFGKINLPCSDTRVRAAFRAYVQCEQDVTDVMESYKPGDSFRFNRISKLLWSDLFHVLNRKIEEGEIVPKHGAGSTADSLSGNGKWSQKEWTTRLDRYFDIVDFLLPNARYHAELANVTVLEPGSERPVKVISVPKTLKTPRIIAMEPTCMMYAQQALLRIITEAVDANNLASRLLGWQDEKPNHLLAHSGSLSGDLATLDLREASDRVSVRHVEDLLGRDSPLFGAVMACRSSKAEVQGEGLITLSKYASMGSALTFPLEAMVFTTAVFMGIELALNRRLTYKDIQVFADRVRVYGDDIIVPVDCVAAVRFTLESLGFVVNTDKSFWTGRFRESCGKEFYAGEDVTIVRVRSVFPSDRMHVRELERTVALRNHLYHRGLWKSAAFLDNLLERLIPFPRVAETSPVLGRHSYLGYDTQRMHATLHAPLVRGCVVIGAIPSSKAEELAALLKVLVTDGILPNPDPRHLERAGRPRSSITKTGWFSPF